jgi:protein SCO1/2
VISLRRRRLRSSFAGAILLAAAAAARLPPAISAPFTIDSTFSLKRTDGRTVTDRDFRGKWMIVYFGYTFCPDICPTVLSQITNALAQLGAQASRIQPIFITVDPARDSTTLLATYLKAFDPRFVGLRGDFQTTRDLAEQFHAYFRLRGLGNGQYTVDHSSFIYVFDPHGKFVELLTGDTRGHSLADAFRKLVR